METSASAPKKRILAGQYEVLEIVGRGASSVVYRARYLERDQSELAIKVLLNKDSLGAAANRLRKEALAMVAARHKYTLRLDDFHSLENLHYLTMELAPHSDLRKFLNELGRTLSSAETERYFQQMAEALSFVHNVGIIHRDLKPDNILVINDRQLRLGDFSASLLPGEKSSLEELQRGIGSLDYLAPEVLRGETYGTFSDIYSLGLTFYECITGSNPLASVPIADMLTAREDENFAPVLTYCPDLNRGLAAIIMKCISFDPSQRYQSGAELLKALEQNERVLDFNAPSANTAMNFMSDSSNNQDLSATSETPLAPENTDEDFNFEELFENIEQEAAAKAANDQLTQNSDSVSADSNYDSQDSNYGEFDNQDSQPNYFEEAPPAANDPELEDNLYSESNPSNNKNLLDPEEQSNRIASLKNARRKPEQEQLKTTATKPKYKIAAVLIVIVACLIAYKIISFAYSNLIGTKSAATGDYFLPFEGDSENLSFPTLAAGSYLGKFTNLLPDQDTKFFAFSYPESNQLKLLIGLEGLSPITLDYSQLPQAKPDGTIEPLTITISGYVLELHVDSTANIIKGNFINLVTNQKGYWELAPVA